MRRYIIEVEGFGRGARIISIRELNVDSLFSWLKRKRIEIEKVSQRMQENPENYAPDSGYLYGKDSLASTILNVLTAEIDDDGKAKVL